MTPPRVIELRIVKDATGREYALWRVKGARSGIWTGTTLATARRAIRDGQIELEIHGFPMVLPVEVSK